MDLLVTYDIDTSSREGERRLAAVAKVCEEFGVRVQDSVFECRLSATAYERLVGALLDTIDRSVDSANVYAITGSLSDVRTSLGRPPSLPPGVAWVV